LAHGAAKRNRVARGDPDWRHRLLDATNGDGGRRNVDELAMILERLLGQAERNDIEEFIVDLAGIRQIGAETLELEILVAGADAEFQATIRDDIGKADLS